MALCIATLVTNSIHWKNNEKYLQTHIFTMLFILSMRSIEDIRHYRMKITGFNYRIEKMSVTVTRF